MERRSGTTAALIAAAMLAGSAAPALAQTELRLSVETPPGHLRNQAAERWAEAIEEKSGGDITVEIFPSGQLYPSSDAIRALASGALDLSVQASPTLSQFEPNLSVITLPMFFGATREQVREILDGPLGTELWEMVAQKGIVVPEGGQFEFAPNNTAYTTEEVAVDGYDALEGVKLAAPPSPVVISMLSEMGANPVATPRTEIVLQLTQGQIDGMGSVTDLTISGGKLWEAGIAHALADNAGWGVYIPLVSQRTLNGLSDENARIVEEAWAETVGWARERAVEELEQARALNEENGVTYHEPDEAEITATRERMLGVQDEIVSQSGMDPDFVSRVQDALLSGGN